MVTGLQEMTMPRYLRFVRLGSILDDHRSFKGSSIQQPIIRQLVQDKEVAKKIKKKIPKAASTDVDESRDVLMKADAFALGPRILNVSSWHTWRQERSGPVAGRWLEFIFNRCPEQNKWPSFPRRLLQEGYLSVGPVSFSNLTALRIILRDLPSGVHALLIASIFIEHPAPAPTIRMYQATNVYFICAFAAIGTSSHPAHTPSSQLTQAP